MIAETSMGAVPLKIPVLDDVSDVGRVLGDRVAAWVRREGSAKEVARIFGVAVKTAENWRAGQPPLAKHLWAMVGYWGAPFLEDVFAPQLAENDRNAARQIARLKHDIAVLEGLIDGDGLGGAERGLGGGAAVVRAEAAGPALGEGEQTHGQGRVLGRLGAAPRVSAVLFVGLMAWQCINDAGDDFVRARRISIKGGPVSARVLKRWGDA